MTDLQKENENLRRLMREKNESLEYYKRKCHALNLKVIELKRLLTTKESVQNILIAGNKGE